MSKDLIPEKYRDEDLGVNDDASEWSPEPFLDYIGSEPITIEKLMDYLEMFPELPKTMPVEEVVRAMRSARK